LVRRLDGRTCIVTGASKGLGRAIALRMANEGCDVVVNYNTSVSEAAETAAMVEKANRRALLVKADVSRKADVELLSQRAIDTFGKVDVLVNNAGVFMVRPSLELTEDEWDRTIDVNLKGVFLCSTIIGKTMADRRTGAIVNISSVVAFASFPNRAAYCAAKAGVVSLTKTLAIEWAEYNVRVNCVAPAYLETDRIRAEVKAGTRDISPVVKRTPLKRLGYPSEVASVVAFLASDDASFVTGETAVADGGWLAYGYV
jgi:NAD(P)-dependent dehydrogenase (short-subunit alcohol dehydrogenase family)